MKPLRALIVEDSEQDARLLVHELRRGGYDLTFERVDTPEAMNGALEGQSWDIVLSDCKMPRFSAQAALSIVKDRALDLPFIIVSGMIGEEAAVTSLRAGAHDFIVKGALARLLPAIDRELREAAMRADRKKMREQLLISERMASVGTLAAGVAHEINNPLAILVANLEFVSEQLTGIPAPHQGAVDASGGTVDGASPASLAERVARVKQPLRDALEATERVRLIARDLKVFSRAGDEERRGAVDIHAVLESSVRMASNEIRHRARLVKDYGEMPLVEANEARLGQVFLNLIVNAAQAIPEGQAEANEIRLVTRMDGVGRVVVEVRDTGAGIPQAVLPRIFHAFFTTKPVGIGTGLGLAICHRIVTAYGGEITVESQVGSGTVFRIALPPARADLAEVAPTESETIRGRRGRILVIDDEPMLCTTIQRVLAGEHDVTIVTAAKDALRRVSGGEEFDLILSDMMMPEMTGMDLHRELVAIAPDQARRMVFMTGGAFTDNARQFLAQSTIASIEKPFKAAVLRETVRSLLN
jgi:signal transduction histidine kinase